MTFALSLAVASFLFGVLVDRIGMLDWLLHRFMNRN